jgi:hypothetical protein
MADVRLPATTSVGDQERPGREPDDLSDEEIEAMHRHAEAMADLLIDIFLTHRVTPR